MLQVKGLELYQKRDYKTGVFLWTFQYFLEHLFWRTSANRCLCMCPVRILQWQRHLWKKELCIFKCKGKKFCDFRNTSFVLNFCLQTFKNMSAYDSIARLKISSPSLLFCSICMLFCDILFDIAVCHSVTL